MKMVNVFKNMAFVVLMLMGTKASAMDFGPALEHFKAAKLVVADGEVAAFNRALEAILAKAEEDIDALSAVYEALEEKITSLVTDAAACRDAKNILERIKSVRIDVPEDLQALLEDAQREITFKQVTALVVAKRSEVTAALERLADADRTARDAERRVAVLREALATSLAAEEKAKAACTALVTRGADIVSAKDLEAARQAAACKQAELTARITGRSLDKSQARIAAAQQTVADTEDAFADIE
jgi:chromosome segregation ATPase